MGEQSDTLKNLKRGFPCIHCRREIFVPRDLPPTQAPCPHCHEPVLSPRFEAAVDTEKATARVILPPSANEAVQNSQASKEIEGPRSQRLSIKVLCGLGVLVALVAFVPSLLVLFFGNQKEKTSGLMPLGGATNEMVTASDLDRVQSFAKTRWIGAAEKTLAGFLAAETAEERAKWTIGGKANTAKLEAFYQNKDFSGTDTSAAFFSPSPNEQADTSRGIFLLIYNRPEQFSIGSFFRPVPPMRVKLGLEEPDTQLASEARVGNFISEPVRVMAYFKKQPDETMLLDWETFVQTKYRLFKEFIESPEAGKTAVFRVFLQEDVDIFNRDKEGYSVFRVTDPAYRADFIKTLVKNGSEIGRVLAPLKWRGMAKTQIPVRNATVRLSWSNDPEPVLVLSEFLCWEFLGLGGKLDN